MSSEINSASAQVENDMDPLSKGEPDISGTSSPESLDGGRPDGAPGDALSASVSDGESLEEPGAGPVEGTAS